ncbi:rhodanese-like domain-containing protein 4, chloroplastic isoform X2 [Salvia miltiorrhiza]|uniref:rhodanese-like domain-containing protein 4, chloroplastic isoform X2 n=1 Tax=Salvia miltiorrhiza TaxID=226208 RepID=UPI0025ABEC77|nr:rhodanese-like domain-containing protein 4, chloroplastic isoform X2 [Salvia miltiorrhiza]
MEALNAVGVKPLPILAKQTDPNKYPTLSPVKIQSFPSCATSNRAISTSGALNGGLALLSSFLSPNLAEALTYDEALRQSDFDVGGALDGLIRFAAENPIIAGGGAAVVAVPVAVAWLLLGKAKPWGVESAKTAYAKLGDDANAQLLDIRSTAEIKQAGSPNIRGLKKKPVVVSYNADDKLGFLKKLNLKFKEPENTTLFVLDKFDGSSELVAELVTSNGFKAAYAIRDGAEGSRGWVNSGLPWIPPTTIFDINNVIDTLGEGVPVALGIAAAAAGLGLLAFTEAETILQVLGSAAVVQFVSKKLLFAEDRKKTIKQFEELLNTKVAPKELVDDIQQIGKAILPELSERSVPVAAEATDVPRPLSPYPNYPDYRPPSSPTPSQP